MRDPLLYTYYGDDFTGSTDVLEQLARGGIPSALFLAPPTVEDLALVPGLRAYGIAGESRSQSPEWMKQNLPTVFRSLQAAGAPITHYKVCSTFDSSPQIGSIGCAMEIGREIFQGHMVPIVVGAPHLRRYVWRRRLYAAGPDGRVLRIDRHPMSRHPVTPMCEADLRRHLCAQTTLRIDHVDYRNIRRGDDFTAFAKAEAAGADAVLFDTVRSPELSAIGRLLWQVARQRQRFAVGSSGLTAALVEAWRDMGLDSALRSDTLLPPKTRRPLLVLSGSCSVATERQLRWALAHDFVGIALHPEELLEDTNRQHVIVAQAIQSIRQGRDTVLYSAMGAVSGPASGSSLGELLGIMMRQIAQATNISRVLLCGGDTSSHAVRQLGLRALTWQANLHIGVPLCRTHGALDIELALKGGQMGDDDFFQVVRDA
ncbi:four-carbon acid sugar kinase family protein [Terriglobus albidus]|uniref:Four-carbon acid sugar kinase family protein n=1 Tax=Terriglobus albidus TaxID=1592106 RepID=A0A5B9EHM8_9BACT|nr:four-carbon acid sugar kinase family protein [Terriglobus albidus]QEE29867.1 four-carbon acid sugar kinase family protein [Terriglobus albidus]